MKDIEYKEWYENVDFIQENMQIYSFSDFIENYLGIKLLYNQMPRQGQKLYQWYLFASSLSYHQKCLIWNYINNWIDYQDLLKAINVEKYNKYYINVKEQRTNE